MLSGGHQTTSMHAGTRTASPGGSAKKSSGRVGQTRSAIWKYNDRRQHADYFGMPLPVPKPSKQTANKFIAPRVPKRKMTTVVLRGWPTGLTRSKVVAYLDAEGFKNLFDFVFVPLDDRLHVPVDFAIVNFCTHKAAVKCIRMHPHVGQDGTHVSEVAWSCNYQGLTALVERFRNDRLMIDPTVPDEHKPALFSRVRVQFHVPSRMENLKARRHISSIAQAMPENVRDEMVRWLEDQHVVTIADLACLTQNDLSAAFSDWEKCRPDSRLTLGHRAAVRLLHEIAQAEIENGQPTKGAQATRANLSQSAKAASSDEAEEADEVEQPGLLQSSDDDP
mmetsp:Transcript_111131/g.313554  ORF Transcript_111131/g.313554 Transcript_111131/m.313554 type:complete len:335 (-) Transcript_111131:93-1097(-)